ncbi:MAG: tetratricopeptide repeat protein, partial [Proteobacteria bacterium]|nr:tetratricopeptide repeat protein [Pseudomonadota bacterium]
MGAPEDEVDDEAGATRPMDGLVEAPEVIDLSDVDLELDERTPRPQEPPRKPPRPPPRRAPTRSIPPPVPPIPAPIPPPPPSPVPPPPVPSTSAASAPLPAIPASIPSIKRTPSAPVVEESGFEPVSTQISDERSPLVDRALAVHFEVDHARRAAHLATQLEVVAPTDPGGAGILALELGELCERRLGDEERALTAYRRGFALSPSLRPNLWSLRRILYRRASWAELVAVIDAELGCAVDHAERVTLLYERALVLGREGADDQARATLENALNLSPTHQGALFELERIATRTGDRSAVLDTRDLLARAIGQPERKIAYWLAVATEVAERDHGWAFKALEAATQIAAGSPAARRGQLVERVARARLRIAEAHGTPAQLDAALDAVVRAVTAALSAAAQPEAEARRVELVELRRRQAHRVRGTTPSDAWELLGQALTAAPQEAVVLVELVELAVELGRTDDLPVLVSGWHAVEDEISRARMLSFWCAESHLDRARREPRRTLLRSLELTAPGYILLTSVAECGVFANPGRTRAHLELATTYLAAAGAAVLGTWSGPGRPTPPDPQAAVALYVQAAELLAYHVA